MVRFVRVLMQQKCKNQHKDFLGSEQSVIRNMSMPKTNFSNSLSAIVQKDTIKMN